MTESLNGRRAIVIGASTGIGLATARLLAGDGAAVTICGRTASKLEAAADDLARDGLSVASTICDAMDGDSVRAAVASAADDAGRLDIAVVVPGSGTVKPVLLFDDDEFSATVDINVRPVYLALKYAGQAMIRAGGGSFVAISSTAAAFSNRYLSSYCAGKAAVDQLVCVAADELGEFGVRVNSVRPGLTRTDATTRIMGKSGMTQAFIDCQPLKRTGEADDIAHAIRYLAGPESSWTTGQHLAVDGGHTLRAFIDYTDFIDLPDQRAAAFEAWT